ncbi:MAG TPA: N-6 DNA methylase [Desulfobacteria bacterium]|nr:N-6 DNA methylase [Desulfobacteria bacterium]
MTRGQSTEVDAYIFIKENLKAVGWDTRNPTRHPTGQVYTQNECHSNEEIHNWLQRDTPENIIKVSESVYWVIEAKREHRLLQQALDEAEEYANKLNRSSIIKAKVITGVAGNETDSYLIKSKYHDGNEFRPIKFNNVEISGLLSPEELGTILRTNNPEIDDVPLDDKLFLSKAEKINEILHLGAVNPHNRANVMSALLLSMLDDTPPNIDAQPSVLISDINSRARRVLRSQGKPEFYEYIKLSLPPTEDNHAKFKNALVKTLQELNILNIRSAMNSGADVLGKFYEVFLKYANWAKELGIVLTPRHITSFAVNVMNVNQHDLVFDPTCGTGGFLVVYNRLVAN